jgi:hypothetical protein
MCLSGGNPASSERIASEKTVEELGLEYLRQVVSVVEDQMTRLCADWNSSGGPPGYGQAKTRELRLVACICI